MPHRRSRCRLLHEIDHIISRKHAGTTTPANLAFACFLCNRYKGSDVACLDPATGLAVRLFHPRKDRWEEHFRIAGSVLEPLTSVGSATTRLLRLNTGPRVMERRALQSLGRYPK